MKTYSDMTFDELLKYKDRLMDDGVWLNIDIDEKKEINEELERKFGQSRDENGII
jgi:hypothetical protein